VTLTALLDGRIIQPPLGCALRVAMSPPIIAAPAAVTSHEGAYSMIRSSRLAAVIAEGQRYKREKEELESRVNAIEQIARDQARPTYLMDAMADVLPADLWLSRIEEKGQQLRLAGTTYSAVALSDFMSNLKASGKFKDVDLVESRQDLTKSPRTITFEVSCRFEV